MTELDLNELALAYITAYGAPMVGLILLIGAMGIPLPGTLVVIASGAFVKQGFLDFYSTPSVALAGAVIGDCILYSVGRFARGWIESRFGQSQGWRNAKDTFERRGGIAIYLTRWLLTPIAIPTTLIAGGSGYPFLKMLLFDAAGELTWIVLYGGLGYAFGSQWELINDFISNFSGVIIGVLAVVAGLYLVFRRRKKPVTQAQKTGTSAKSKPLPRP